MAKRCYYETLEITRDADGEIIKKSYRKLAVKFHPDKNPGDHTAEAKFKELGEAYETLKDPDKRRDYDRRSRSHHSYQHLWKNWAGANDFDDYFQKNYHDPSRPVKGKDIHTEVEITLEQAATGCTICIKLTDADVDIEVRIPAGVDTDNKLKTKGCGYPGKNNGPHGDLFLHIRILPHPIWERDDNDLYAELPLSLETAIGGGELKIPSPMGEFRINIPAGTQSGTKFNIRGKGMPDVHGYDPGDIKINVQVEIPTKLSWAQKQTLLTGLQTLTDDNKPIEKEFEKTLTKH